MHQATWVLLDGYAGISKRFSYLLSALGVPAVDRADVGESGSQPNLISHLCGDNGRGKDNTLYLVFKMVERLSSYWRGLNGGENLMILVLEGYVFKDGTRQLKESPHKVPQRLNKEQILTLARNPY
jgi:hypothetical protein